MKNTEGTYFSVYMMDAINNKAYSLDLNDPAVSAHLGFWSVASKQKAAFTDFQLLHGNQSQHVAEDLKGVTADK